MRKFILLIALLSIFLFACQKDFLDRRIDTTYEEADIFTSYSRMRDFAHGIYTYLPNGFDRIEGAMLASASDEAAHAYLGATVTQLSNGSFSSDINPDDQWANLYAGIRKSSLFLEKSANFKQILARDTITSTGKAQYLDQTNDIMWLRAEARFLRALFYFELIKRYGGVPLIKKTLTLNDNLVIPRSTFAECVTYITDESNIAADTLRLTWKGFSSDGKTGRATKGAAYALKARTLLYAASPLNNPSNDLTKWQTAAAAAKQVIDGNQYSLGLYDQLFKSFTIGELIFEKRYTASNSVERYNFPIGYDGSVGGTNPTQNLVDAYEMKTGTYDPQNPYANRDPRLGLTIVVNDATFKNRKVEVWKGGKDEGKPRATRTGYYLRKGVIETVDLLNNTGTGTHTWPIFRYGELLLIYAEAMNEAYGPDVVPAGFTLSARAALNMVRNRGGVAMPAVTVAIAGGQAMLRDKIKNERRVELAFEEHRYWDVRRWKIAAETLGADIRGVEVVKDPNNNFIYQYNGPIVEKRVFTDKMYLYPIPRAEVIKSNGIITQNPGWE